MSFKTILFTALLILGAAPAALSLGGAPTSEIKWDAVQWAGTQRDFSASSMNVGWRISETAERIVLREDTRSSAKGWLLIAHHLNPDGSGRINLSYHDGRPA